MTGMRLPMLHSQIRVLKHRANLRSGQVYRLLTKAVYFASAMQREPIDWVPRAPRKRATLTGLAVTSHGMEVRVLVSNLSYQGCHLWSDHEFTQGEKMSLNLPGYGNIEGQVRWLDAGRVGIRFLTGVSAVDDRRARLGV